jgi:hypothetical protein
MTFITFEKNTISNEGTSGVGVFKQQTGSNFEFKNINSSDSIITINDDTVNNEIDFSVNSSNIDITTLNNHPSGDIVGTSDTQVLSNKTIDVLSNTIINLSKSSVGLSNVENLKVNLTATTQPTSNDDSNDGYSVGSIWIDTVTKKNFINVDSSISTAIWNEMGNAVELQNTELNINSLAHGHTVIYDSISNKFVNKKWYDDETTAIFFDDFITSSLNNNWVISTLGPLSNITVIDGVGGQLKLTSGNITNDFSKLCTSKKQLDVSHSLYIKLRIKLLSTTDINVFIGSINDNNNLIKFTYDSNNSNWFSESRSNGNIIMTDTTIVADLNWHIFEIKASSSAIRYSIDGNIVSTLTTNIPTLLLQFYIQCNSLTNLSKSFICDYVTLYSDRDGLSEGASLSSGLI